jgi:Flp pilus assembly protein TadG
MTRLPQWLARLRYDTLGGAAIEMVLIMPAMLAIMGGIYDGARLVIQDQQIQIAVDAGADWARANGWSASGTETAITNATPAVLSSTSAQLHIRCYANGSDLAAGSECPGGGTAGDFVVIEAASQFTPALPWDGLSAIALQGQAVVRVP